MHRIVGVHRHVVESVHLPLVFSPYRLAAQGRVRNADETDQRRTRSGAGLEHQLGNEVLVQVVPAVGGAAAQRDICGGGDVGRRVSGDEVRDVVDKIGVVRRGCCCHASVGRGDQAQDRVVVEQIPAHSGKITSGVGRTLSPVAANTGAGGSTSTSTATTTSTIVLFGGSRYSSRGASCLLSSGRRDETRICSCVRTTVVPRMDVHHLHGDHAPLQLFHRHRRHLLQVGHPDQHVQRVLGRQPVYAVGRGQHVRLVQ
mmetsp:Transcript_19068/g.47692  ORF Transcript_19068/g.47692 Transcript_19068/m.47692 type:complete len:257 (+) Transcript_19068:2162-2932(+)